MPQGQAKLSDATPLGMAKLRDLQAVAPGAGGPGMQIRSRVQSLLEQDPERTILDYVIDSLPTMGGLGLSLAAGGRTTPVGIGAAALGGATGESVRQFVEAARGNLDKVPPTFGGRIASIAGQGALQAGAETVGRGIAAAGGAILRSSAGVRPADVQRFGNVGGTMTREGIPVGPGLSHPAEPVLARARQGLLTRGSAVADRKLTEAVKHVNDLLTTATKTTIDGQAAVKLVDDVMKDTLRGPTALTERSAANMSELRAGLVEDVSGGITPARAHELKQDYQAFAKVIYDKRAAKMPVTAREDARARFAEAAAKGLRSELGSKVSGYIPAEHRVQQLMGAKQVVSRAEASRYARHGEFGVARVPLVAALLQVAADPVAWSRIGLALQSVIAKQAPKAVVGAVEIGKE